MNKKFFFDDINILMGPNSETVKNSILIIDGKIEAFGEKAKKEAFKRNIQVSDSGNKLIAPMLVDAHSILKDPLTGIDDDLKNLKSRAKRSGYCTIAFLPESNIWRDQPEKIPFQTNNNSDINILYWGSFTLDDEGKQLSPHDELLESGVIGLSSSYLNDLSIIFKGLTLNSIKSNPLLLSLTKKKSEQKGIVNKDLKSLQSGFYTIDNYTELAAIKNILEIQKNFPNINLIISNLSDSNSLEEIKNTKIPIYITISWWNLVADTSNLKLDDLGWKSAPPIGSYENRELLIQALENDLIHGIAVNSIALNDQKTLIPINDRSPGISSFELVLPLLWEELIKKRAWSISKLWKHLSFKPSNILGISEEKLTIGSNRWLLFDPDKKWVNNQKNLGYDSPSNYPKKNELINGKVIEVGFEF